MQIEIKPADPSHEDVQRLIRQLDTYISDLYPAESNHMDGLVELAKPNVYFIGAYDGTTLAGIGAVKILDDDGNYGEIKRVFVSENQRGKGISKAIMKALEDYLIAQNIAFARLETGIEQPEAIGLYEKAGYYARSPFGAYQADPLSLFMEKKLSL